MNTWFHIAATAVLNSSSTITMEVFKNGVSCGTSTFAGTALKTVTAQDIEFSHDSGYKSQRLDDIRIYNRKLSAMEIYKLYTLGQ